MSKATYLRPIKPEGTINLTQLTLAEARALTEIVWPLPSRYTLMGSDAEVDLYMAFYKPLHEALREARDTP